MNPETFDFSKALTLLREGKRLARVGWNGKGMYIYFVPANSYPAVTEIAKKQFGETVPYRAYFAMKTAQNDVAPWSASNSDLLATDWYVVPETPDQTA